MISSFIGNKYRTGHYFQTNFVWTFGLRWRSWGRGGQFETLLDNENVSVSGPAGNDNPEVNSTRFQPVRDEGATGGSTSALPDGATGFTANQAGRRYSYDDCKPEAVAKLSLSEVLARQSALELQQDRNEIVVRNYLKYFRLHNGFFIRQNTMQDEEK